MSVKSALKGWIGETAVALAIRLVLDRNEYHALHNITLETAGGTAQIDHLVVSRWGIFVIETKTLRGAVSGKPDEPWWAVNCHGRVYPLRNPLHQNQGHVKALREVLKLPRNAFIPLVCFAGWYCSFQTAMPAHVILGGPCAYIAEQQQRLLTDEQVREAVAAIKAAALPRTVFGLSTLSTRRRHLASISARHPGRN